ncbi:MAG: glycosyltransferase family 4 protein [Bacteroidales bacterium]|nr:glycosyltransferase family 4 protein [Bacteroidales bacterium]
MRIVYCIHSLVNPGGKERVLSLKANALAMLPGYEIWILTAHQKGQPPRFPLDPAVHLEDLGCNDRFGIVQSRLYRHALDRKLCEIRPDITVSLSDNDIYALPKCHDGSVKIAEYHFTHDKFYLKYGRFGPVGWYSRLRTRKLEKAVARLDGFIVLTLADQEAWKRVLPAGFPVEQIYNPLTFTPSERADTDCQRAIAIGRLSREKNFADAIDAWVPVARYHPDWTFDIFGSGSKRKSLQRRIERNGLQGKVRLMGHTPDIRKELLRSGFLIVSSRYEGLSMVLLEAAACGLPVVSYRCPCGPAEVLEDGASGHLVPPGDKAALSRAILSIIGTEDREVLGAFNYHYSYRFAPDTIIAQWDRLFKRLVGTP